eukprot:gene12831-8727_t
MPVHPAGVFSGPPSAYSISSSRVTFYAEEPPADQSGIDMPFLKHRIGAGLVGGDPWRVVVWPAPGGYAQRTAVRILISSSRITFYAKEPPADQNGHPADIQRTAIRVLISSSRITFYAKEPPADQNGPRHIVCRRASSGPEWCRYALFEAQDWRRIGGRDPGGQGTPGPGRGACAPGGHIQRTAIRVLISSSRITFYAKEPTADQNGVDMPFLKHRTGAGLVGGGPRVAGSCGLCTRRACSADHHPHIRLVLAASHCMQKSLQRTRMVSICPF